MFKMIIAAGSCSNLIAGLALFFLNVKQDQNKGTREVLLCSRTKDRAQVLL